MKNSATHEKSGKNRLFSFLLFTVTQILINGFLSIGLLLYCIFAVILLIGISEVCYFVVLNVVKIILCNCVLDF